MKRALLTGLSLALAGMLIGCWDNGSHLVSNTDENTSVPTSNLNTVAGVVEASYLKGVKVCVKNTEDCAVTGDEGNFTIETTAALPLTLEIKVGESVIGEVKSDSEFVEVTPLVLAENNETVAGYVGAMLHLVSNCDLAAEKCDLSGVSEVDVDEAQVAPLVKEITEKLTKSDEIEIKANGKTVKFTKTDAIKYMSINPTMTSKKLTFIGYSLDKNGLVNLEADLDEMTLNYTVFDEDGNISVSKTSRLVNKYQNVVFTLMDDNESLIFLSPAFGAFVDENGKIDYALEIPDVNITADILESFVNKSYYVVNMVFRNFLKFTINSDDVGSLKGAYTVNDGDFVAQWDVEGKYIRFLDRDGNRVIGYGVLKMGENKNSIVITAEDFLAVGVEAKPIDVSEADGEYYYLRIKAKSSDENDNLAKVADIPVIIDDDKENIELVQCYGKAVINGTSFSYKDEYCSDSNPEEVNETLIYNPEFEEEGKYLEGIIQVKDKPQFILVDKDTGMFYLIDLEARTHFFGSSKPIK